MNAALIRLPARLFVCTCLAASSSALAQEILLTGPLRGGCVATSVKDATPANWEWAFYDSVSGRLGKSAMGQRNTVLFGLGSELTRGLLTYSGFPSGYYGPRLGKAELRAGPWLSAQTSRGTGFLESGLTLQWGATYHASFGTFSLRPGIGYGAFGEHAHGTLSLTYGAYSALGRYTRRGHCDPEPRAEPIGLASVARLFVTTRRSLSTERLGEVVIGVELSPTFLFPPYDAWRLAGGPPPSIPWQPGVEP